MTIMPVLLKIQQDHQDTLETIDTDYKNEVARIEQAFRDALEKRENDFVEVRDAAIEFDINGRRLALESSSFDHAAATMAAETMSAHAQELSQEQLDRALKDREFQLETEKLVRDMAKDLAAADRNSRIRDALDAAGK